jgi:O-antigen chain-terminating methyltransferase
MIEARNLEINVDELMQKIREEVDSRHKTSIPEAKFSVGSALSEDQLKNIECLLNDAEANAQLPTKFPDKLNRFPLNTSKQLQKLFLKLYGFVFKKQRVVNLPLIQAAKDSLELNRQLIEQVTALQAQVKVMGDRINATESQVSGMGERLNATEQRLSGMGTRINTTQAEVSGMGTRINTTQAEVIGMSDRVNATESQVSGMSERLNAIDQHLSEMGDHLNATVNATEAQVRGISERVNATESQVSGISERVNATESQVSGISERVNTIDERYIKNETYLKNDLAQQKRILTLFLEEARLRLPEPFSQEQLQTFVNEQQHLLDAFYAAFEDKFRGSREEIIGRLIVYLPLIQEAKVGTPSLPILDLGCGRGEWLELLNASGYTAHGLDINRVMIEQCRVRGLEVAEGDVITYLQSLPDASLGAVTGFHIIEHFPFELLIKLIDETTRVLKPGGLAIFETPNPQNVLVGSNTFYVDPTHRNPLPSSMIKFLVETRGLCRVKVIELHPYPEQIRITGSDLGERFSDYFYGPQDYAVLGYKV